MTSVGMGFFPGWSPGSEDGTTEDAASIHNVGPCLAITADADRAAILPMETMSPPWWYSNP